ncbi:hypothetical protein [Streptomyces sp. AP-93]|uniref:hypothetical protein n=1 Tax=Streptomyces sp. AP-93 TaxID=2929048 RepID=UPI001FAF4EC5|nr:hypothetical protein [Streptomyces sp. AP-93]MCJ0868015.1 hypothetical protein [Streptomyces sp. AP-93]
MGTPLSKDGNHGYASRVLLAATREFEDLAEPENWPVAHRGHQGHERGGLRPPTTVTREKIA